MLRPVMQWLLLAAFVAAGWVAGEARAADRVALVIGNSAYQSEKTLTNPANDASDVSNVLRKLGFEVIEAKDLDKRSIERRTREFRDKLQSASVALLFYAGHGMQVNGANYILPIDAQIKSAEDVKLEAVELETIMLQMRGEGRINIIILDACRDNPYARNIARSTGAPMRAGESAFGGLAEVKSAEGTVIIFATDPGNVASDGTGRNSPFTEALLRNIEEPGLDLGRVMMKVRYDVIRATERKQLPWESSSLVQPIYLAGDPGTAPIQQAALVPGVAGQARSLSQTREGAPPRQNAPAPGAPAPNAPALNSGAAVQKPADTPGEICDRLANAQQDPLRRKDLPIIRNVDHERAIPACEAAVAAAPQTLRYANQLGRAYLAAKREEDAVRIYRDAAERGAAYSMADMGFLHFRGWGGVNRDYVAGRLWSEKAARLGVPMSMTNMAYMLGRGLGGERDQAQAKVWYTRAYGMNEPATLVQVAAAYLEGWGGEKDAAKAREILIKTAERDEATAFTTLGFYYQYGIAGPRDFEEARIQFDRAAAAGDAGATAHIGAMYREGDGGFPRDHKLAREWYERAAKLNNANGHLGLALLYAYGEGVPKDLAMARTQLEAAARHDNFVAIRLLAQWLEEGFFGKTDREEARKWLKRGAEQDDELAREQLARLDRPETSGEACDRLAARESDPLRPANVKPPANLNSEKAIPACEAAVHDNPGELRYANQLGVAHVDSGRYGEARTIFEKAAEKGAAFSALWVGNLHNRGLGVPKNLALGTEWFKTAAELGSMDAMFNLALAYQQGDGTKVNYTLAHDWYEKAAAKDSAIAMRQLGWMYYNGTGRRRDYVQARQWFEKAAGKGDAQAMRQLGLIFERGFGIAQNLRLARQWYSQAAAANDTSAMQSLAQLYISGFGGAKESTKARGLLEQAAGADVPAAMVTLAQGLLAGAFGENDEPEARKWLEKASVLGNETAKAMLQPPDTGAASAAGETCDRTAGISDDPLRSVAIPVPARIDSTRAIPACTQALAAAPANLRYANQLGLAHVMAGRHFDAMRVFRAAADRGSAFAQLWIGNLYNRGMGVAKDERQAALWYEKAAENGFALAMYNLAVHHSSLAARSKEPEEQTSGYARAKEWHSKAAELGHADAMWAIAKLYELGRGVEKDPARELEWLEKASDFGSVNACNDLAVKFIRGNGVPVNHPRALELLEQVNAGGHTQGEVNLAHLLIFGKGVTKDLPRARKLLEASAKKQNVGAIVYLAQALDAGTFGNREASEARRLLQLAIDLDSSNARDLLAKMK